MKTTKTTKHTTKDALMESFTARVKKARDKWLKDELGADDGHYDPEHGGSLEAKVASEMDATFHKFVTKALGVNGDVWGEKIENSSSIGKRITVVVEELAETIVSKVAAAERKKYAAEVPPKLANLIIRSYKEGYENVASQRARELGQENAEADCEKMIMKLRLRSE